LGVRRAAGLQARALNNLGKQIAEKLDMGFHPVKEIQGHTPIEVLVGSLLGIFVAAGFALL
jgi:acid phosphatase family membrane protein YuiD